MIDKELHEHKFAIRNLFTQTVTLYPDRAQIVRQIKDIPLVVQISPQLSQSEPSHRTMI